MEGHQTTEQAGFIMVKGGQEKVIYNLDGMAGN